jgi:hypothetical protein
MSFGNLLAIDAVGTRCTVVRLESTPPSRLGVRRCGAQEKTNKCPYRAGTPLLDPKSGLIHYNHVYAALWESALWI